MVNFRFRVTSILTQYTKLKTRENLMMNNGILNREDSEVDGEAEDSFTNSDCSDSSFIEVWK